MAIVWDKPPLIENRLETKFTYTGLFMIRKSVPVLMYHHISPLGGPHTVHPDTFRAQLEWLCENGYRFLTTTQFLNFYLNGEHTPKKSVLLTFDDGWLDNWVYAAPLLDEFKATAVMFVISSWPGEGAPRASSECGSLCTHSSAMTKTEDASSRDSVVMRWSELLSSQERGIFELQSHSHSHGDWWNKGSSLDIHSALQEDLKNSKHIMHEKTGSIPSFFCWPKGFFSQSSMRLAREEEFSIQFSTLRGGNTYRRNGSKLVRRLNVEEKPISWFSSRINLYSNSALSLPVSILHQSKQSIKLASRFKGKAPKGEFLFNPLRLI